MTTQIIILIIAITVFVALGAWDAAMRYADYRIQKVIASQLEPEYAPVDFPSSSLYVNPQTGDIGTFNRDGLVPLTNESLSEWQ